MGKDVVLLGFWPSPFSMKVMIAMAEKGVDYELLDDNLPDNKSDLLLKMNPIHKKTPVLIHNNNPLCESTIIVEYIDEVWNHNSSLLPSDPYLRAQARFWTDFIDKKIFECSLRVWKTKGEEQEAAKKEWIEYLNLLEQELGDKPYFGGNTFGLVDLTLVPYYTWFYMLETFGHFKIEESSPNIIEWTKRCIQRESVAHSLANPNKVYEFFLERKKRLGLD